MIQLYQEIRRHQTRLGTPAERPGDFERVLALAHDINNRLTVEYLNAALESRGETPDPRAFFHALLQH